MISRRSLSSIQGPIWLAAICFLALAARAAAVVVLPIDPASDAYQYLCMARSLAARGVLEDCYGNMAYFSAGYPLMLGLLLRTFGDHLGVAYAANVLLGTASVALVAVAAKRLTGSGRAGFWSAACLAFYLEAILYADYLAKENLAIFITLCQLILVASYPTARRSWAVALALGLTVAAQALTALTSLALLPALALYLLLERVGWYRAIRDGALTVLVAGLCLAPWLARNERAVGAAVLNTNGGFNLYIGNNETAGIFFTGIENTPIGDGWQKLRHDSGEYEADQSLRRDAVAYIETHPVASAQLWVMRLAAFWTPPFHMITDPGIGLFERVLRVAWLGQFLLLFGLALVPLAARDRNRPALVLLYGSLFLSAACYAPFFINYRFRLPAMVLVCVAAGWGIDLLVRHGWRRVVRESPSLQAGLASDNPG